MAIFSDRIETAYYISEDYSTIQVEWKDDAGNIVIHICPADPENGDFKALQEEGWDTEKLTEGTAAFKRMHNSGFNALVNTAARKLARQMVADMRIQVENAERDRLANVREKATKEEAEASEILKNMRAKIEQEQKNYQELRDKVDRDERVADLNKLRDKIESEKADYEKLKARIERDTSLDNLTDVQAKIAAAHEEYQKMSSKNQEKLASVQAVLDEKREKVQLLQKDIMEKSEIHKKAAANVEEKQQLAKIMEKRIREREEAAKAELHNIRKSLEEKENMTRQEVNNLNAKLLEKQEYLKGISKSTRKAEVSVGTELYETVMLNNVNKDEVFKFKLWALEQNLVKEFGTKEHKSALRKVKSISEGLTIIERIKAIREEKVKAEQEG